MKDKDTHSGDTRYSEMEEIKQGQILTAYSLYDETVTAFYPPSFYINDEVFKHAIVQSTQFQELVKNKDYKKYIVYKVGTYNITGGEMQPLPPQSLFTLESIVKEDKKQQILYLDKMLQTLKKEENEPTK